MHISADFRAPSADAGDASSLARRDKRVLVIVTIALWTANCILLSARAYVDGEPLSAAAISGRLTISAFGCGLCYFLHLVLSRVAIRSFRIRVAIAAVLALAAAEIYGWMHAGAAWLFFGRQLSGWSGATVMVLGYYASTFFAWTTLYLALTYSAHASRAEKWNQELRSLAQAAQLHALRYQLNPHFLFNTLNSLSALILDQRSREANEMVERLSRFLRLTLASDPLALVPLETEMELQKLYLEIEQVRYPDLQLEVCLPAELRGAAVPALILQPIIENSIKHTVAAQVGPTRIRISARAVEAELTLAVSDDGQSTRPAPGTGLGLKNVRERLQSHYGGQAALNAKRMASGFRTTISLPLEVLP